MPGKCPVVNRCNTDATGWLNDPHPTVSDGITTRKVCYHWVGDCCRWSNTIEVLNCGDFYIYKLVPPPACALRYCGKGEISSKYACKHSCPTGGCPRFSWGVKSPLSLNFSLVIFPNIQFPESILYGLWFFLSQLYFWQVCCAYFKFPKQI